jgi:ATP-dependent DNA helicase RecG
MRCDDKIDHHIRKRFPFLLTADQEQVISEIVADMAKEIPMNRLLQGDVGSGKTDLALVAMLCAVQNGYQAAFMAPTTVLAEQHYIKLSSRLQGVPVRVRLVLGKHTAAQKKGIYKDLREHKCDIVIGTHALIQSNVEFAKLGLAVIDEQHRFGVIQRQILKDKGEENIDILLLTATPIPRTLALTFYGDLHKSIIDEMPPGRLEIKTYQARPSERNRLYEFCRQELRKDNQIYIVYPLIEESEKIDLQAAVESYEIIRRDIFPEYTVGLLHGRLKEEEKENILNDFRKKEIKVLVSTTVIEVGVDVPDATVMIIENAVRFGLAQLHQLRGRVGRSAKQAYCFLVAEAKSPESKKRLQTMVSTNDGFKIAEADLELRGPGDFLGIRQSGLPELRVANLIKDEKVLNEAKNCAFTLIAHDPLLQLDKHKALKQELLKRTNTLVDYIFLN